MTDNIIHAPKRYPVKITIAVLIVVTIGTAVMIYRVTGSGTVKIDYSKLSSPSSAERKAIDEAVAAQAGLEGVKAGTKTSLIVDQYDGETAMGTVTFSDKSAPKKYTAQKKNGVWKIISYKDR